MQNAKTYVFHERKQTLVHKEKYLEKCQYFMKISGKMSEFLKDNWRFLIVLTKLNYKC